MGLGIRDCQLLMAKKKEHIDFSKTIMLGRQTLFPSKEELEGVATFYFQKNIFEQVDFSSKYAEPFFKALGAEIIDSMDSSDYENASVIHDLNNTLPEEHKNKYTVVLDGGTLEHVFNFPVAIKSAMEMIQVGGHYIGITPTNNQCGHGFYQFSPELYFRIFSKENGFEISQMLIRSCEDNTSEWYEIKDPMEVRSRVSLINNVPSMLVFFAKKTAMKEIFSTTPQQSDYAASWEASTSESNTPKVLKKGGLKKVYHKFLPDKLQFIIRNIKHILTKEIHENEELGQLNSKHFRKVDSKYLN